MKKFFFVLPFLALASAASAANLESTLGNNDGRTIFEKLNGYFDTAMLPYEQDVRAWISGRCFSKDTQDKADAAMLAGFDAVERDGSHDNGPLFPPTEWSTFKFFIAVHEGAPATEFDTLDESERKQIQKLIESENTHVSTTRIENGSLLSDNPPGNTRYLLRTDGQYFFTRVLVLKDQDKLKAGDTVSLCYYFTKVK